jgi:hypothetical protein
MRAKGRLAFGSWLEASEHLMQRHPLQWTPTSRAARAQVCKRCVVVCDSSHPEVVVVSLGAAGSVLLALAACLHARSGPHGQGCVWRQQKSGKPHAVARYPLRHIINRR